MLVPCRYFGAETIRLFRVQFLAVLVFWFVDQYGIDVEDIVIGGGIGIVERRGLQVTEVVVILRELAGVETVANVDEVLLRRAEFSSTDGAAQDNKGEDQAEDGDLAMPESSLESSRPLSSQTLL